MIGYVYQLRCPVTKAVVYVGSTIIWLKKRLSGHNSSIRANKKTPLCLYFNSIGAYPEIEMLEKIEVDCIKNLRVIEVRWIERLIWSGIELLNKVSVPKMSTSVSKISARTGKRQLVGIYIKANPDVYLEIKKQVQAKKFPSENNAINTTLEKEFLPETKK